MKNTPAYILTLATLFALATISILYLVSDKHQNHRYASFERYFVTDELAPTDTLNLNYSGYYFAGQTNHTIYLSHPRKPTQLIAVDRTLRDTTHYTLRVDNDSLKYRAIRVTVDSPYFYMADGTQPFIYKGILGGIATPWITDIRFIKSIPLSSSSVALIAIRNMENTFVKKVQGVEAELFPEMLEEQGEGIFSTDGMFRYDRHAARLVYLYFYRNQYVITDTTFQTVLRGYTLDSISKAKIKTTRIPSANAVTMSAPALRVNNDCAVYNNTLYVNSNLLGKNENTSTFERAAVTDVYDLATQQYQYSYHLPFYTSEKPREFVRLNNCLVALYETRLIRYTVRANNIIAQ